MEELFDFLGFIDSKGLFFYGSNLKITKMQKHFYLEFEPNLVSDFDYNSLLNHPNFCSRKTGVYGVRLVYCFPKDF